ncbi:hypothetical protein PCASD_17685, partial [Puccinia coronata f. sp. avenae]
MTELTHPYTCLACSLAFSTAQTQRTHYATDLHRYNSKRAVAGLTPVDLTTFTQKFSTTSPQQHQDTQQQQQSYACEPCGKSFSTLAAQNNHLASKKHHSQLAKQQPPACRNSSLRFATPDEALKHMLHAHGFFLPDQEYLVDRPALLQYLAETVAVWNVCLYCGTGFGGKIVPEHAPHDHASLTRKGLESVRKHMCDKNHCKLAWDTEEQRLEYSDFFDYRASYKNHKSLKSKVKASRISGMVEEDEWEDAGGQETGVLGDTGFELVLPNGARVGHRSLRYIYKQNLLPYAVGAQSTPAGNRNINLLTRMAVLASPAAGGGVSTLSSSAAVLAPTLAARPRSTLASSLHSASLIPSRGGGINFNARDSKASPQDLVIKARNPGEAKMAGHHIRTFKDVHKRQLFQTRVACTSGNNQKH